MMRSSRRRIVATFAILGLLLTACGPAGATAGTSSEVNSWIDQPSTGYTLPFAPFTLKAHARHAAGGGITRIDFLVNSVPVGSVPTDASQALAYAETGWNPSAPGLYRIQAQAFAGGDSNYSQIAVVCVSSAVKEISLSPQDDCNAAPPATQVTQEPQKPSGTPDAPGGPLGVKGGADATVAYYGQCAKEQTVVRFDAAPSSMNNVASMAVGLEWRNAAGNPLSNEELAMTPVGTSAFQASLDLSATAPAHFGGDSGLVYYSFVVRDAGGGSLYKGDVAPIQILPCKTMPVTDTPPGPPPPQPPTKSSAPPPPLDNTPPLVGVTSVSSSDVYYTTGCGPNSLTVEAQASDASGVASVQLIYGYVGTGSVGLALGMSPIGPNTYQASINVGAEEYGYLGGVDGQISLDVQATDSNGNTGAASGGSVKVHYCPG